VNSGRTTNAFLMLSPGSDDCSCDGNLCFLRGFDDDPSGYLAYKLEQREAPANKPTVLFCGGYRSSSMTGRKGLALAEYCFHSGLPYCRFEYRGHGESSGNFLDMTITNWIDDTLAVVDRLILPGDEQGHPKQIVLVGSSMGAWIGLHVALRRPERVVGLVGIAAAPDFTEDVWKGLAAHQKERLDNDEDGVVYLPSAYDSDPYPFTGKLIQDARNNWLVLNGDTIEKKLFAGPVRLLHGLSDKDVPWQKSLQLAEILQSSDVELTLIKDGDHRISQPRHLKRMLAVLEDVIDAVC